MEGQHCFPWGHKLADAPVFHCFSTSHTLLGTMKEQAREVEEAPTIPGLNTSQSEFTQQQASIAQKHLLNWSLKFPWGKWNGKRERQQLHLLNAWEAAISISTVECRQVKLRAFLRGEVGNWYQLSDCKSHSNISFFYFFIKMFGQNQTEP